MDFIITVIDMWLLRFFFTFTLSMYLDVHDWHGQISLTSVLSDLKSDCLKIKHVAKVIIIANIP